LLHQIRDKSDAILENQKVMIGGMNDIAKSVDRVQETLSATRNMVADIMKDQLAPRYCFDVPEGGTAGNLFQSVIGQKVKVYFVCPFTLDVPRDKNGNSTGYTLRLPSDWVVSYGPAILFGMKVIGYAFAAGRCGGLPLPRLDGIEDLSSKLIGFVDFQQLLTREMGPDLVKKCSGFVEGMMGDSNPDVDKAKSRNVLELSYESILAIAKMAEDEGFEECGLVKVTSEKGATEFVDLLYEKKGKNCFSMTPDQITQEMNNLNPVADAMVEGNNKELQRLWKEAQDYRREEIVYHGPLDKRQKDFPHFWHARYFVLYDNGDVEYFISEEDFTNTSIFGKRKRGVLNLKLKGDSGRKMILEFEIEGIPNETLRTELVSEVQPWLDSF
jgi:hypothetical protein